MLFVFVFEVCDPILSLYHSSCSIDGSEAESYYCKKIRKINACFGNLLAPKLHKYIMPVYKQMTTTLLIAYKKINRFFPYSWSLLYNFTLMEPAPLLKILGARYNLRTHVHARKCSCAYACIDMHTLVSWSWLCRCCSYWLMAVESRPLNYLQGLMQLMPAPSNVLQTGLYLTE